MLVRQPFTPLLWACIIATVFLMALVFWLYSHLSVRGAYPVRSARQGKRYCPGLPVVLDMAARAAPACSMTLKVHGCSLLAISTCGCSLEVLRARGDSAPTSLCAAAAAFAVLACVPVGCQQMCAHTEAEEKSILYESWCTILGKKRGLGHHGAH